MRLRRLSRSPLFFWVAVALLSLLTATVVGRFVSGARAEASRYGSLQTVAVAVNPVEAGAVVEPDDVALRSIPAAFLPEGWFGATEEVVGRTALASVVRGQTVVRTDLAPWGLKGLAALLPPGTRAVSVPTGAASPPLHRGDVVDVLATFDPQAAGDGDPAFAVALRASVVDVGEDSATVAVTPAEATRVVYAVSHGAVSLAITADPAQSPLDPAVPEAPVPDSRRLPVPQPPPSPRTGVPSG
ncbi:MAG: Flp pilus assembly protein CpaB [Acidimicrobiia bacterium]|nr:Flp pilus assembly protein CpaB [Acidimicrobiia bacterium]